MTSSAITCRAGSIGQCETTKTRPYYREPRDVLAISYTVPEADAITGWRMVDQSGRRRDFRQVKTKVNRKSRKYGGESGNVASERSIVFREIPVLVEAQTILRRVPVEGAFQWNMRYRIVQIYETEHSLAGVRKNPVTELLIASS